VAVLAPVAALDVGCGARADQNDDPLGVVPAAVPDAGAHQGTCPDSSPAIDSACSDEGLSCSYSGDACSYSNRRCLYGIWQLEGGYSCNPPPPQSNVCPEATPEIGSSCAWFVPGLTCEYEYCYGAVAPLARCSETLAVWEAVDVPSCNPPAREFCPDAPPEVGSSCFQSGQLCVYGVACGDVDDPLRGFECVADAWQPSAYPECPASAVDAGPGPVGSVDGGAGDGGAPDAGVADGD